eukprot:CCRYP_018365-RA/>CCRYP_018365-RA protein AED:0.45 eAED:0.45 QI:0/0/0/1/0/0/2/0/132
MISNLVNKTWFSRYPLCQYIIYDNGSEVKLHFKALCDSYGITNKPTNVKNPQANAILEQVHQVISSMLGTAEIDIAPSVEPSNIDKFVKSRYESDPWTIISVHTNGTTRIQHRTKSERLNIQRVTPFFNNQA